MPSPLHPSLAQLAARYDQITVRWSRGEIDAGQARREMAGLTARDDNGTQWTIDPDSGEWVRQTHSGEWVFDQPPPAGIQVLTAHDLSTNHTTFNPNHHIQYADTQRPRILDPSGSQTKTTFLDRLAGTMRNRSWNIRGMLNTVNTSKHTWTAVAVGAAIALYRILT